MLKTITKFLLESRKTVQMPQQQVIEEDDARDSASASEELTQPAEPQLDLYQGCLRLIEILSDTPSARQRCERGAGHHKRQRIGTDGLHDSPLEGTGLK